MTSRISVKQFSLLLLLAFSLTSLAVILYATFNMHRAAITAQVTTMEKVVEVAANEQMRQVHLNSNSFAQSVSQRLTQKNYWIITKTVEILQQLPMP